MTGDTIRTTEPIPADCRPAQVTADPCEYEEQYRLIVEAATDYAILTTDAEGRIASWSPGAEAVFGWTPGEAISQPVALLFTPEDRSAGQPEQEFTTARDTGFAPDVRWHVRKDGSRVFIDGSARALRRADGAFRGVLKVGQDTTGRRLTESRLRASEERFRTALGIETVGAIFFDAEGRLFDANDAFLRMGGYDREDLLEGRLTWQALTPPEWMESSEGALAELRATGRTTPYEKEYLRKDGSRLWGLFAATLLPDGTGFEFVLDVTERKRAEAEREAFVDAAAHDLKSPLTVIWGQAQLLRRQARRGQGVEPTGLEAALATIEAAAGRMVALVDEMMDAAHLSAGRELALRPVPVDLVALVEATAEEARQGASGHTVRVEAETPMLVGEWDAARLGRVLANLLSNAVKYSRPGTKVLVRVGREEAPDGGAQAVVAVRDEGAGIPAADLPHLFERFHRGTNVAGRTRGSGIGLAGASHIVTQHGGTIGVESAEGRGSTFTVRLPLAAPDAG